MPAILSPADHAIAEFLTPEEELRRRSAEVGPLTEDLGGVEKWCLSRRLEEKLSFRRSEFSALRDWKPQVTRFLEDCLKVPARPEKGQDSGTLQREIEGDCIREEVRFVSRLGLEVRGTVFLPRSRGPHPCVVILHDMSGLRAFGRERLFALPGEAALLTRMRERFYGGVSLPRALAKTGYASIVIDALMFGDRLPEVAGGVEDFRIKRHAFDEAGSRRFSERVTYDLERPAAAALALTGSTWAGAILAEDMSTVDYVTGRPDIDADRVACMGLSFGAYRTNYLFAMDERIRTGISCCWLSTLRGILGHNVSGAAGQIVSLPGLAGSLDLSEIASVGCPRPFFAISGWHDRMLRPHGIADAHLRLRAIWAKAGHAERLGSVCFDGPHAFLPAEQNLAVAWLRRWL